MYIAEPATLTESVIGNQTRRSKYTGLLNANFQDYMDALSQGGQFKTKAQKVKIRISSVGSSIGIAVGALGGPAGMALGFTLGNSVGKYVGDVMAERIYGQAIFDMSEIAHEAKIRHAQLATSLAFTDQIEGAIDTLRENHNKREKDNLQAMQV